MADISTGRSVQDKDNVGGLRAAYFLAYTETDHDGGLTPTFDGTNTDVIDSFAALNSGASWYKYDLQGTSTADETLTASRENGTIFSDQTITLNLKKLGVTDPKQIYDLATGRYFVLIEQKGPNGNNGVLRLFGLRYGCDVESSNITSGAAQGDGSNFTITLKGMEPKPASIVEEGAIWATGDQGSLVAADIKTGQTINGTAGSAT